MKSPEYFKEQIEKREALKESLPIDKRLEGTLKKTKWSFESPLYTLRRSPDPSDRYFIEQLTSYHTPSESSAELLKSLEQEKDEEVRGALRNLEFSILYEKGISDSNSGVRRGTAEALGAFASINPELASTLYEKGMGDRDRNVRRGTARALGALASINPELASTLYEKGMGDRDRNVRRGTARALGALASINPELASTLYEKGMGDSDADVRRGTAQSLGALASVNPELFVTLYEKGISDIDWNVRKYTAKALGALASINPELFVTLYEKGMGDRNWDVRYGTAQSLGALAPVNPELASTLYEKGMGDSDADVRRGTAQSLGALASINPELASTLYEKGMGDRDRNVRRGTARALGALAPVNPELFVTLYEKGMSDSNLDVRKYTAKALGALAPVNPELASTLYEKGMGDSNLDVRRGTAEALGALASINPELASTLYEKGMGDRNWNVRYGTAQSLGALASINPELASTLYEKGMGDRNWNVRHGTAQSLGALASINPELFVTLYEKGMSDSIWNVCHGTARALGAYPFVKENVLYQKIEGILSQRIQPEERLFAQYILITQIKQNTPEKLWEYTEVLEKVRDHLTEKNTTLDPTKQIANVEKWFADNQKPLASLADIFPPKAFGVFLTELSSDSLLYTTSFLQTIKPLLSHTDIKKVLGVYLKTNPQPQPQIEKLLETVTQFITTNQSERALEILRTHPHPQEEMNRILLDIIAQSVGIDSETLPKDSIDRWNTEFLPYLGSNNSIIEERIKNGEENYENVQALYKKIVERGFIGDFKKFIFDTESGDDIGESIARHNKRVMEQFTQLGINTQAWNQYQETQDFLISREIKVNNTESYKAILSERVQAVVDILKQKQGELTERQYAPLMHILEGAKNKGIADTTDYETLKKKYDDLYNRITTIKQEVYPNTEQEYFGTLFEHLGHLQEAVELFQKERITGTETKEQGFRVKLWDRDPAKDLFQGNYTHCCIAVGVKDAPQEGGLYTHDPATVAQFLSDAGIQVAEIYDQEKKNPIANTWLFVSKDRNGEPILVLDNVEVHNAYTKDVHLNNAIRDNLFAFVTSYAKACNIPKVGLGRVGTNDINWRDLPEMDTAPVEKVGGYLKDYTSSGGVRAGRYYLEAYNAQTLAEIYTEHTSDKHLLTPQEQLRSIGSVRIVNLETGTQQVVDNTESGLSGMTTQNNISYASLVRDIEAIENNAFGEQGVAQSIDSILGTITQPKSTSQVFMEHGKIVGYLSSLSADRFIPPVRHPEYDARPTTLYIESIAGKTNGYQTFRALIDDAKALGYTKINLHGINPRLNMVLHRVGFETKAVIPNWLGHQAEYMEMEIEQH